MHLRYLSLAQFRNLQQLELAPHPRFTVIHGENGQGKTNLLEALYLLATLRSFRTTHSAELVRFGEPSALLRARVDREGTERLLAVTLFASGRKSAQVDGKAARGLDYFGGFGAVLFTVDDLGLPKGPPSGRRRLLDRAIFNQHKGYLAEVQDYEKVLRSRNATLRALAAEPGPRGAHGYDSTLLDTYDEQLAALGALQVLRRHRYLREVEGAVEEAFARISGGLRCRLSYEVQGPPAYAQGAQAMLAGLDSPLPALKDALRRALHETRAADLARGFTRVGPHSDDLTFWLADKPAALHASQGQTRALLLAFKIAEIGHLLQALGDTPVLLLDDVSSELDQTRNSNLFQFLESVPCQTFITTTSAHHIQLGSERLDVHMQGGCIDSTS